MSIDDIALTASSVIFVLGLVFAGGSSLLTIGSCSGVALRNGFHRLLGVGIVGSMLIWIFWYSFHPYAGVLLPNVFRTLILAVFVIVAFFNTKGNWTDIKNRHNVYAASGR